VKKLTNPYVRAPRPQGHGASQCAGEAAAAAAAAVQLLRLAPPTPGTTAAAPLDPSDPCRSSPISGKVNHCRMGSGASATSSSSTDSSSSSSSSSEAGAPLAAFWTPMPAAEHAAYAAVTPDVRDSIRRPLFRSEEPSAAEQQGGEESGGGAAAGTSGGFGTSGGSSSRASTSSSQLSLPPVPGVLAPRLLEQQWAARGAARARADRDAEPLLAESDTKYCMFPIEYPDVWEMYKKALASFWTVDEVDLGADLRDWRRLSEGERHFIKTVLAFFAASDGIVLENLAAHFMQGGWVGGWVCCAVLCCAVLCCAVLCCAVLCCAVLCCCLIDCLVDCVCWVG